MKRRVLLIIVLTALVAVVGFAPAPLPRKGRETKRSTFQRMQGWWEIVTERWDGRVGRGPESKLWLHVKDDRLQYFVGESGADAWTITVDESVSPPALDKMSPGSPKGTKATYLGRIQVQGNELKIGWLSATERPTDLSGDRGASITFRRSAK